MCGICPIQANPAANPCGSRVQVANKALEPRWSKTGNELFFLRPTNGADHAELMAVPVQTSASGPPRIGPPRKMLEFPAFLVSLQQNEFSYSPNPDGKRFLVDVYSTQGPPPIHVITNWQKLIPRGSR